MLTRCPNCNTTYRIHRAQLEMAEGQAHCYRCDQIFNAQINLLAEKHPDKEPTESSFTSDSSQNHYFDDDEINSQQIDAVITDFEQELQPRPLKKTPETDANLANEEAIALSVTDLLSPAKKKRSIAGTLFWLLLISTLLTAAIAQFIWFQRDKVIAHPQGRLLLEKLCHYADCQIPPFHDTSLIKIIRRQIASHPQKTDTLFVQLLIVNQASQPQPYPILELSLSTAEQLIARRSFLPSEYRETGKNSISLMPPGISQQIEIEIKDPGPDVTGFEFEFF